MSSSGVWGARQLSVTSAGMLWLPARGRLLCSCCHLHILTPACLSSAPSQVATWNAPPPTPHLLPSPLMHCR